MQDSLVLNEDCGGNSYVHALKVGDIDHSVSLSASEVKESHLAALEELLSAIVVGSVTAGHDSGGSDISGTNFRCAI